MSYTTNALVRLDIENSNLTLLPFYGDLTMALSGEYFIGTFHAPFWGLLIFHERLVVELDDRLFVDV